MAQSSSQSQLAALYRKASDQGDVVSTAQLYELEFSFEDIRTMVRRGVLHRLSPGIYSVGLPKPRPAGWLHAGLLLGGPGSFLSHRSGPPEWDLWERYIRKIHVSVPEGRTPRGRAGITFHRTTDVSPDEEVTTRRGLRVATIPRMLVELSATESVNTLVRLIEKSINHRHFDSLKLEEAIARHTRRPGVGRLKTAAAEYRPHPDRTQWLEGEFKRRQERDPRIPPPVYNYEDERPWEIDVAWPERKVCLELDGRPYHEVIRTLEKDQHKMTRLQLLGWRAMRVTDVTWKYDADGTIELVLEMLDLALRTTIRA